MFLELLAVELFKEDNYEKDHILYKYIFTLKYYAFLKILKQMPLKKSYCLNAYYR